MTWRVIGASQPVSAPRICTADSSRSGASFRKRSSCASHISTTNARWPSSPPRSMAPAPRRPLGWLRACADADGEGAEVAVLVRSDLKGQGLGRLLMQKLIGYCGRRGMRRLWMSVLNDNLPMLRLGASLGFRPGRSECNIAQLCLELPAPLAARG